MNDTGIIRGLDKMGRVVIPKELRKQLNVQNEKDSFIIFAEEDKIILKKYEPHCIFCEDNENVIEYEGKLVCENCISKLKDLIEEEKINNGVINND